MPGRAGARVGAGIALLNRLLLAAFASIAGLATASLPDPDFALQGEYLGSVRRIGSDSGAPLGAQVVAQGEGSFNIVFFPGGLPGAGAQGDRYQVQGARVGSALAFSDSLYTGGTSGDTLKGFAGPDSPFILVKHARVSPTLGLKPPAGATVLFDGGEPDAWTNAARDVEGNLTPLQREAQTTRTFLSFSLHLEFRMPYLPWATGPARGNSGIRFLDDEFFYAEIQLLDSFGRDTGSEECGGIEGHYAGRVMASLPPQAWQTMDIQVSTPSDTSESKEGALTVWHNGILIHSQRKIPVLGGRVKVALQSLDTTGAFRNVWLMEGDDRYPLVSGIGIKAMGAGRGLGSGARSIPGLRWRGGVYRIDGIRAGSLAPDPESEYPIPARKTGRGVSACGKDSYCP